MAYRRTEKMQQRVDERRKSILKAAEKLFAEKGFEATTMKDITKAAGTSIGNLYFYFPNKEELMMRLIEEVISEIWDHEFDPEEYGLSIDELTHEAVDDYLKIQAFFSNETFAKNMLNIVPHKLFRKHILRYMEGMSRLRYQAYGERFSHLDIDVVLAYHLGGLLTILERVLVGELDRSPHQIGMYLAESKLQIRGVSKDDVAKILAEMAFVLNTIKR
ncbi:MAG: helix-turn-helix transcriptional regulator [Bacteroidetes bacterium]|nr:helix-turn-helix transcriptional regulator [Bacteroidota bacterium]MCH8524399.1 TetR/AcrR family transcriptional regulator [Balneolales bacterium]